MTTDTISTHISTLQELAAGLTDAQNDHQRLDTLVDKIHSLSWKLSLEIEDAPSRIARHQFKEIGKTAVTIRQLATFVAGGDNPAGIGRMIWLLRNYLQLAIIQGFRKNKQWYCTQETLAGYYRERSQRQQRAAKQSLEMAA